MNEWYVEDDLVGGHVEACYPTYSQHRVFLVKLNFVDVEENAHGHYEEVKLFVLLQKTRHLANALKYQIDELFVVCDLFADVF